MFEFWPVYSGERFRASWPSCFILEVNKVNRTNKKARARLFKALLS